MTDDAFRHHPELRGQITPPDASLLRSLTVEKLAAKLTDMGLPTDWFHPNDHREALRAQTLAAHPGGDLWVFAYGSLMWDPGFHFTEVRRAHVPGYARRFILKDIYGGRGTADAPGLMAALDTGPGCDGLVFRIDAAALDTETEALWRRELIGPAYTAQFVTAHVDEHTLTALTFVADHDATLIDASLSQDEQVHYLATGTGFMGTSLEYICNVDAKFTALGLRDNDVAHLLSATHAYLAQR